MVHLRRLPPRLRPGDRVRRVSPASRPDPDQVQRGASFLSEWGLRVEVAAHAFDRWGHYLGGRDEDRLADLDGAFRDPGVRAVYSTTGGKGSYRIAVLGMPAIRRHDLRSKATLTVTGTTRTIRGEERKFFSVATVGQ